MHELLNGVKEIRDDNMNEIKGGRNWKGILWRFFIIMANYWGRRVWTLGKNKEKYYESAQMLIEGEHHGFEFSVFLHVFLQQCSMPVSNLSLHRILYYISISEGMRNQTLYLQKL